MEYAPTHYGRQMIGQFELTFKEKLMLLFGGSVKVRMGVNIPTQDLNEPKITSLETEIRVYMEIY